MSRPPLTGSAVVAIFASSTGCRNEVQVTSWPSSTRRVVAPARPGSSNPRGCLRRRRRADRRGDGRTPTPSPGRPPRRVGRRCVPAARWGIWPGPSDKAMGTTTPIRIPASLASRVLLLPKTDAAPVGWFELVEAHERAGDQREGEAPPASRPQHTCRGRQPPSHDSGRSMRQRCGPSRCEDATPRRATRQVSQVAAAQPGSRGCRTALSAWSVSGRWCHCPRGSAPPEPHRPSLRAIVNSEAPRAATTGAQAGLRSMVEGAYASAALAHDPLRLPRPTSSRTEHITSPATVRCDLRRCGLARRLAADSW
jgi:hypothetical protein